MASGQVENQVEDQVGLVRERFFTPRLRVSSYEELNALLLDRCVAYAKAHKQLASAEMVEICGERRAGATAGESGGGAPR